MSQLLHAGIIAGRRQLAALLALTLILLVIRPQDHIAQNSSASNKAEILSAMQLFTWAALLSATGVTGCVAPAHSQSLPIFVDRVHVRYWPIADMG